MEIRFSRQFDDAWGRLTTRDKMKALEAIELFMDNPADKNLRLHQLKGKYYPHHSISIGGDLRIHLEYLTDNLVMFVAIGTHSQLYG